MGHREVEAEDLPVERGHNQLGGAVHQLDHSLGVDAALGGEVEGVSIREIHSI